MIREKLIAWYKWEPIPADKVRRVAWNEEFNNILRDLKEQEILLNEFFDAVSLSLPEKNCTCHLAPPCSDCVENGTFRELLDKARVFIRRTK